MATTGLLALLDDIATVLDDVAVLTKVAAKKTAGVLGDDLALNAEQVSGVRAERELPVVWAVAKGSFYNKLILVPAALLISAFIPWLITPLLMMGGIYLCYEGVEKVLHKFLHSRESDEKAHKEKLEALANNEIDLVAFEKKKIRGAVRTDFILSAEIIVIALGAVKETPMLTQTLVVSAIALFVTIGVYTLVAGIVKLDDVGLNLVSGKGNGGFKVAMGKFMLLCAPKLMKTLSVVGTIAMFLVGGGIIVHGVPLLHHGLTTFDELVADKISMGSFLSETLFVFVVGFIFGVITLAVVSMFGRVFSKGENVSA